jgi:hypothetical protein
MAAPGYFPSAASRLYIAKQNSQSPPSSADASSLRFTAGAVPVRPPPFVATKAAMGAVDPAKESSNDDRTRRHRL